MLAIGRVAGAPQVGKARVVVGELRHELHDREPRLRGGPASGVLPVGHDDSIADPSTVRGYLPIEV
jgi:hypothetical protein